MPDTVSNLLFFSFLYILPVTFLLLYLSSQEEEKSQNYILFVITIFLSFIVFYSLKNFSFGDDFYNYFKIAIQFSYLPSLENLPFSGDYLFWSFLYYLGSLTHNSYLFGFVFGLIAFAFVFSSSMQFDKKVFILGAICILFSRPFLEASINPLRSSIALIFIFYSFYSFQRGTKIISVLSLLIALNLHLYISLLCILFLPFVRLRQNTVKKLFFLGLIMAPFYYYFLETIGLLDLYNTYIALEAGDAIGKPDGASFPWAWMLQLVPFIIIPLIYLLLIDIESKEHQSYIKLIVALVLFIIYTIGLNALGMRFIFLLVPITVYLFFQYSFSHIRKTSLAYLFSLLLFNYLVIASSILESEFYFDDAQEMKLQYEELKKSL